MVFWYIAFVVGAALFLYGCLYLLIKKTVKEKYFIKAAFIELLAGWILYLPEEFFNDIPNEVGGWKVPESILTALLRSINIYLGNGYDRIHMSNAPIFSSIYSILLVVTNIVMLLFVAGFIIQLVTGHLQRLKLSLFKNHETYIFYGANAKALAIAKSIRNRNGDCKIVFAGIGTEPSEEVKEKFLSLKAIYMESSISTVFKKLKNKSEKIEVLLFADDEEKNLDQLNLLTKELTDSGKGKVRIIIELSKTPWDLYDDYLKRAGIENDNIVLNFVRTEESFAYNNLLKNSIFAKTEKVRGDDIENINILIVGMNERNLEMLKAVLHLGQMPGYRLSVMVIDEAIGGRSELLSKMPEVKDSCDIDGDAIYTLHYFEGIDYSSSKLDEIITKKFSKFSFVFVNAGNDLTNINIAMRINALGYRTVKNGDYTIQVNVNDQSVSSIWNPDILESIDIVGDFEKIYDYDSITFSDIEKGTVAIHNERYKDKPEKTWESYCNNEYNRHSVYARTLSFKHKVEIIDKKYNGVYSITGSEEIWKKYEHMRWNMYTRTLGFVKSEDRHLNKNGGIDKKIRNLAKIHNDLIEFKDLPNEEKKKDALPLTSEVVKILKGI